MSAGGTHDPKGVGSLLHWLRPACRHHHKQMLHAPALGNALLWSYVAAYAFKWDGITLLAPIATDREAAHVQVAVVQSFASEVPQRATLAENNGSDGPLARGSVQLRF